MSRIIDFLIRCYEYDMAMFAWQWLYIPLLIPAALYLVFFFVKWTVITAPAWLPISLALGGIKIKARTK